MLREVSRRLATVVGKSGVVGRMGGDEFVLVLPQCGASQAAAVAAFEGPQDFLIDWRERFRARRDLCVAAINAIPGLSTPVPDGAFTVADLPGAGVVPAQAEGDKCPRCWRVLPDVGQHGEDGLCGRCADVVAAR